MARSKRRSHRISGTGAHSELAQVEDDGHLSINSADQPQPSHSQSSSQSSSMPHVDTCPSCDPRVLSNTSSEKEDWVRCDCCKTWFHWRCCGDGELQSIDKWFCNVCRQGDSKRVVTFKQPARKSTRKRSQRDYAGLNSGYEQDPNRWLRMLQGKTIKPDPFKRISGQELNVDWLQTDPSAMTEPVVIENPEGLGMQMPEEISVVDIMEIMGAGTPVEVIDVGTQSNLPGWTLGKWTEYYNTEAAKRDKIRNVISLEVSGTELADRVLPPRLVREIDWVEKFWPNTKRGPGHVYPKVQLYCLMGVTGAWTDWHIDFAGSSVYYHILQGSKVFYFIRPTPGNLAAYERWSGTEMQNYAWLGDLCDEVFKTELRQGNTMIIPTGWIHAVYTPIDTLVFGGNFLHSLNVTTQLRVRDIEIATHVPKKFRFPHFVRLCWYVGEKYLRDLKAKEEFPPRVLESIEALADFLVLEVRAMERGSEAARKEAKEQVPGDRVKDASAMARELRWRVRMANGYLSDDEPKNRRRAIPTPPGVANGSGSGSGSETEIVKKRKRRVEGETNLNSGPFKHFKPRTWEVVAVEPVKRVQISAQKAQPTTDGVEEWANWSPINNTETSEDVKIVQKTEVIVKVRRTALGVERQRVERILEDWTWLDRMPVEDGGPRNDSHDETHSLNAPEGH